MVFSNDPAEISLWRMDVASGSDSNVDSTGESNTSSNSTGNSYSNGNDSDNDCMDVSGHHQNNIFPFPNSSGSLLLNIDSTFPNQKTDSDSNLFLPVCEQCSNSWEFPVSCLGLCGSYKIPPSIKS